jgi:hypothetical protein
MMGYVPKPPKIVPGILMGEAEAVWREWNPLIWGVIRKRGIFGGHFDLSGDDTFVDGGLESVEAPSQVAHSKTLVEANRHDQTIHRSSGAPAKS